MTRPWSTRFVSALVLCTWVVFALLFAGSAGSLRPPSSPALCLSCSSWNTFQSHLTHARMVGKNPRVYSRDIFIGGIAIHYNKNKTEKKEVHMQMNNLVYCYLPKKSPFYYARFTGPDGSVRDVTTKCKDYNAAVRVGAAMAMQAEAVHKRLLPQHKLRTFSRALMHVATGVPLVEPNVDEFLDACVNDAQLEKEESTARHRYAAVKLFRAYLKESNAPLVKAAVEDIRDVQAKGFRGKLLLRYECGTINQYLEIMTTVWNKAMKAGYTTFNPFVGTRVRQQGDQVRPKKQKRRPLKRSEGIVLVVAADVEMTGLLISALNIGGRNGDIAGLRIQGKTEEYDADLADVQFVNKKGKKYMDNAVLPEYEAFRQEYCLHLPDPAPGAAMFPSFGNVAPGNRTVLVDRAFHELCVATKLRDPATAPRSASGIRVYEIVFHATRWTCNMACKMSGMKTEVVSEMLSQTAAVNAGYDAFQTKQLQRAELYKATGKAHLLLNKPLAKVETCMTLQDIIDLTVYATEKLRCLRLKLPPPAAPAERTPETKKVAQPVSEAAQPASDNAAFQTGCPAPTVAQSTPLVNPWIGPSNTLQTSTGCQVFSFCGDTLALPIAI